MIKLPYTTEKKDDFILIVYILQTEKKSDCKVIQLIFQNNLIHNYLHMYKNCYHYSYRAGYFRVSYFYQVFIRLGYFTLLLPNVLCLANAHLNEDRPLDGRFKLWYTDLGSCSSKEDSVAQLDVKEVF